MRILGIDPSLSCTGYGVVDYDPPSAAALDAGVIRTSGSASLEVRLATLSQGIREVLAEWGPDVLVVEQLYSKYEHPKTAILMGHARGVVLLAAAERGLEVVAYQASSVKRSLTGNGRSSKQQVGAMVAKALGLAEVPEPPDVTDALALCLCHTSPLRRETQDRKLPERIARAIAAHGGKPS